jgi:hypothetical protein
VIKTKISPFWIFLAGFWLGQAVEKVWVYYGVPDKTAVMIPICLATALVCAVLAGRETA